MGGERHPDGVKTVPATAEDLATYDHAQQLLAEFSAPVLRDLDSPNDRLFVAAFDGTGNSMFRMHLRTIRTSRVYIDRSKTSKRRVYPTSAPATWKASAPKAGSLARWTRSRDIPTRQGWRRCISSS